MQISKVYDENEARKLGFHEDEEDGEQDFISSDYCHECGGAGFLWVKPHRQEQCESCEELHEQEVRADILIDSIKEGA